MRPRTNTVWVLPGSVLRPLLFVLYINEIHKTRVFNFYLFADDTSMLHANKNLRKFDKVNTELGNLCDWLKANKLSLNIKKSNFATKPLEKQTTQTSREEGIC